MRDGKTEGATRMTKGAKDRVSDQIQSIEFALMRLRQAVWEDANYLEAHNAIQSIMREAVAIGHELPDVKT